MPDVNCGRCPNCGAEFEIEWFDVDDGEDEGLFGGNGGLFDDDDFFRW